MLADLLIWILLMIILMLILMVMMFSFNLLESNNFILKMNNKMEVECGMFSFINKNSYSSLYFLFMVIFLIFDLEVIMVLTLILKNVYNMNMIFFMMINISLVIELFENSLKWND